MWSASSTQWKAGVPYSVVMLFSQDRSDLFAIEILVNVEMPYCVFETVPLFAVHLSALSLTSATSLS